VLARITPFPAAKPSAFTTIGAPSCSIYLTASSISVKFAYLAVGILLRAKKSFENALEPSSCAAPLLGPKHLRLFSSNKSTTPLTNGASGPTTVKSIALSKANLMHALVHHYQ